VISAKQLQRTVMDKCLRAPVPTMLPQFGSSEMSLHLGRKFAAVAVAVVPMFFASVSHAQDRPPGVFPSSESPGNVQFQSEANPDNYRRLTTPFSYEKPFYVACSAEVPSHSTAYFTATFQAPAVASARKEFRKLVTTQYGPVSHLQCAGKFSESAVNEQVQKWKDLARSTKNAIVDTHWPPTEPLREPLLREPLASAPKPSNHAAVGYENPVPGNANFGTAANQHDFQR
jgi:hypothetical protein